MVGNGINMHICSHIYKHKQFSTYMASSSVPEYLVTMRSSTLPESELPGSTNLFFRFLMSESPKLHEFVQSMRQLTATVYDAKNHMPGDIADTIAGHFSGEIDAYTMSLNALSSEGGGRLTQAILTESSKSSVQLVNSGDKKGNKTMYPNQQQPGYQYPPPQPQQ